jgi:hypothetical protein
LHKITLVDALKPMLPDSKIAQDYASRRTKTNASRQ